MDPIAASDSAWTCPACTYRHERNEAVFLACTMCGAERPADVMEQRMQEERVFATVEPSADGSGLATAASLMAAASALDAALARPPPDRAAQISSLVESSMASRIAQERQRRSAAKAVSREAISRDVPIGLHSPPSGQENAPPVLLARVAQDNAQQLDCGKPAGGNADAQPLSEQVPSTG